MKGKKSSGMGKVTHAEAKGSDGKSMMAMKKHRTHMAHGGKTMPRLDKKARGGKVMTPSSPLSGAEPKGGVSNSEND